jgi:hypothetical protein
MGRPQNSAGLQSWDALRSFPPIMVRLAARRLVAGKNVAFLSNREIAIVSGITLDRVLDISQSFSFDEVTVGEAERFCRACNFDPTSAADRKRQREYIRICQKKTPGQLPHFLRSSPHWEAEILPLIQRLRSHQTLSTASKPSPSAEVRSAA